MTIEMAPTDDHSVDNVQQTRKKQPTNGCRNIDCQTIGCQTNGCNGTDQKDARPSSEYGPYEKWRIIKNVLVLGVAFMVHFTAFMGASNLQSSINADEALGTSTLASIYGSLILSNIFLPVLLISWLGCKWTVSLSFIAYMPFIMSQFYPRFYTMIPAGLSVGLGGGPLWCAKCTYLTVAAEAYAKVTGDATAAEIVVVRFFGIFFMFYQFAQVWGNLISSAVLSSGSENNITSLTNVTQLFADNGGDSLSDIGEICGANFCPGITVDVNPNLKPPSEEKIHLISGIYLGCMIAAVLITAIGLDSLKRYNKGRSGSGTGVSGFKLLAVTMKQLKEPYQLLLLPITMFIGMEQAFITADYNASFVSCGWGISNVGYVMICFGVSNAVAAMTTGAIVKMTGRGLVIVAATALHVALLVALLMWRPHPDHKHVYFLMAGLWGVADAVWLVQINALSGILFPGKEEASYSNFRLWEATGSVIAYSYSPYLCTSLKLYILMGLLLVGVIGYTCIEYLEQRDKQEAPVDTREFELVATKSNADNTQD